MLLIVTGSMLIRVKTLKEDHLAGCYWKMGKKYKAKELEERALRIRLRWMPTSSIQTLI